MRNIKYLVIHHSVTPRDLELEKSVSSFDRNHKRLHTRRNSLGYHIAYHYVIAGDGRFLKTRGLHEIWYHASNTTINQESVAICLTGNFDIEEPSKYQLVAFQYLKWELEKKHWPLEIRFHSEFASKSCPWRNVNKALFDPQYWEDKKIAKEMKELGIWNWKDPHGPITREQVAIMIGRLYHLRHWNK